MDDYIMDDAELAALESQQKQPANEKSDIEEITTRAPKQGNGKVDYNALMEQSPEDYATLMEQRIGVEETKAEFISDSNNLQAEIDKLKEKLSNETDRNKKEDLRDEINELVQRKQTIDGIIQDRYATKEENIQPIGKGAFGNIYDQFRGKAKEAIDFLMKVKEGEALGALSHPQIGEIDLVWGKEGTQKSDGFGLAKIAKYHPEVIDELQDIINDTEITSSSKNRINLESENHKVSVRLDWNGENKKWLLTAFEKETSPNSKTTDTTISNKTGEGDTALFSDNVSADKVTTDTPNLQESEGKNFISEYGGNQLTRVRGLRMGQSQAKGKYVSYEPVNRYETADNKATPVEIKLSNPIEFDQNKDEFAALRQQTLENRLDDFKVSDFSSIDEDEIPTIDNLNERGIDRLAEFVTEELKNRGHDGIVFNGEGEHEIVVFDGNNVREKQETVKPELKQDKSSNKTKKQRTNPGRSLLNIERRKALGISRDEMPLRDRILFDIASGRVGFYLKDHVSSSGKILTPGLKRFLGYRDSDMKAYRYLTTLGSPKYYPEKYAESFIEEGFNDDIATIDLLIDVLSSFPDPQSAMRALEKTYIEDVDEYYRGLQQQYDEIKDNTPKEVVDELKKPQVFDVFLEDYANNLQDFTTFDEFIIILDELKADGVFDESSFPFAPNDYIEIKNYINNARNAGYTYEQITGKKSRISGESVPTLEERTPNKRDNAPESEVVESGSDGNTEEGISKQKIELTPLQQKYVDEQTADYDKKIEDAKKAWDTALSEWNKERKKFNQSNDVFREETEQRNMLGDEAMTDVSNENADRIRKKYKSAIDNAKAEYERLVSERSKVIEQINRDAQSQREIGFDNDVSFHIVGEKGAAALDKAEEANTRMNNLSVAKEMESSGKDAKTIKLATGWEKGADGKWRYEIMDLVLNNRVNDEAKRMGRENLNRVVFKLGEMVDDADNFDLFKAYPQLREMYVYVNKRNPNVSEKGSYLSGLIEINGFSPEIESVLIHEIQHAIQDVEGFAKGGNISAESLLPMVVEERIKIG